MSKRKDPRASTARKDSSTRHARKKPERATARARGSRRQRAERSSGSLWLQRSLIGAALVATLISVGDWSLHRSYFSVRVVHINSLAHESRNYVMAVSGLNDHPAMIDVSDAVIVRRIERLRWVASASVTKKWPDSMTIHVVERVPVAVVYAAHHALERVDASDHYLDTVAVSRDLPLLEVVGRPIDAPWRFAPWSRAAAQVAGALPRELQNQVAAVRVTKHGVVSLRLTTPLTFVLGTPTQLTAKFESVASVIKASAVHSVALHAGDVIDVSVPGTLTVSGPS